MANEDKLIDRITLLIPSFKGVKPHSDVPLGIGDDAAILRAGSQFDWVVTTDASIEGVHFLGIHPADSVGYKSLARATSDIAAMGAKPAFFLLTLGLPIRRSSAWLDEFLLGMERAASELGLRLVGGDTTRTGKVVISITVIGKARNGRFVTRYGAKPGDAIYVTGKLGGAQLGLELIRRGFGGEKSIHRYLQPHLYPKIDLKLGQWLAARGTTSAMMDLSDGLSTDLARLCAASRVGARLHAAAIPTVHIPADILRKLGRRPDPVKMALNGGEDYALLFTVRPDRERQLRRAPGFGEITRIGEIVRGSEIEIVEPGGRMRKLPARGWDSFRR